MIDRWWLWPQRWKFLIIPAWFAWSIGLLGCARESEPSVEELMRRQKQQQATESRTSDDVIEAKLASIEQKMLAGGQAAAQLELRPLLIQYPQHPGLLLLQARIFAAQQRYKEAIEIADAIDDSNRQTLAASLWLVSQWASEVDDHELSLARLRRLIEVQGASNRLHRRLAQVCNQMGLRMEAAVHLQALADSGDIREQELFAMNTYGDPFIDESIPKPNMVGRPNLAWLAVARRYRADGDLRRAREVIDRLAAELPDSTSVAAFRGRVYNDFADDDSLQHWLARLPERIENEPEYWATLGHWTQRLGNHDVAIRCFLEAVNRDPTDRFSYLAMARSLHAVGRFATAKSVTERFETLDEIARVIQKIGGAPGTAEELQRMANALDRVGRPAEALAWRKIAIRSTGPSNAEATYPTAAVATNDLPGIESAHVQTCGIEPGDWPLPNLEELGKLATATPIRGRAGESAGTIEMADRAAAIGIGFAYNNGDDPADDSRLLHQMTGGGIGVIDFDLDGWPDLYFSQAGGPAFDPSGSQPNALYRNLAGNDAAEVTLPADVGDLGYGQGIAVADINQDGFPDILVANIGPNVLYVNQGDGTFVRHVLPHVGDGGWTTSIACGDLDGDGLPEIVEVNYVDDPTALTIACTPQRDVCNPSVFRPAVDRVLSTTPTGNWVEWTGGLQMGNKPNYGFGVIITNVDGKFGNDVFIANDTGYNHLWISDPDPDPSATGLAGGGGSSGGVYQLRELATLLGCAAGSLGERQGCMGIASGDFDRNGHLDFHVTNYWDQPADHYLQQPEGHFINGNRHHGVADASQRTVGWGAQSVDLDRDGWLDLVVLNGHLTDHRSRGVPLEMKPQLFQGSPLGFSIVDFGSMRAGTRGLPSSEREDFWDRAVLGRTLAVVDWNRDGKPDLIANSLDRPVSLLENRSTVGNFLRLQLIGVASERDAIGAKVQLRAAGQAWSAWQTGGSGFLAANEGVVDFGLGQVDAIETLEVHWPSGNVQRIDNPPLNQTLLWVEGDAIVPRQ